MSYDENEIDTREEQAVERAWEFADDPLAQRALSALESAEGETLTRIYVELLGLLPLELEPVRSTSEQKQRLLAAVRGVVEEPVSAMGGEEAERHGEIPANAGQAVSATKPGLPATPFSGPHAEPEPSRRHRGRWLLPVAAIFLIALLTLSGWLTLQVQNEKAAVARLNRELIFAQQQSTDIASMRRQVKELDHRLQLVTSPASEFCPLRPTGGQPLAPGASGVLFVGPNHQHWYLALYGLKPPPAGRTYQLWFVVDGQPVSVATFSGTQGSKVEFASDNMPHNTNAVAVTLEPAGGMPQPTGPQILQGDQMTPLG